VGSALYRHHACRVCRARPHRQGGWTPWVLRIGSVWSPQSSLPCTWCTRSSGRIGS